MVNVTLSVPVRLTSRFAQVLAGLVWDSRNELYSSSMPVLRKSRVEADDLGEEHRGVRVSDRYVL